MRPIEVLMSCIALAASIFLLAGLPVQPPGAAFFLMLLGGIVIAHLVYEGEHWQIVPLYIAIFVLLITSTNILLGAYRGSLGPGFRVVGGGVLALVLAAAAVSWIVPMFRLPRPTGPHRVGTRILYMTDPKRDSEGGARPDSQRELMVQIWYPAEAIGHQREIYRRRTETTLKSSYQAVLRTQSLRSAPILAAKTAYPLLIFSPAWTGQRTQSTFLMQEMASHGFVVASIDHTYYSGLVAFPDGRVIDSHRAPALGDFTHLSIREGIELANQFVRILADDILSVLDWLAALNGHPEGEWFRRLDFSRVGVMGHSIGGAAGAEACGIDPRIGAALNFDGWTFGDTLRFGLAKPWMVIYGKGIEKEPASLAAQPEGVQRYWQMNRENHETVTAALRENDGYCLTIRGCSHWNFADRALYSPLRSRTGAGTIRPKRACRIIAAAARAFFVEALNGRDRSLVAEAVSVFPEVDVVIQPHHVAPGQSGSESPDEPKRAIQTD